MPWCFDGQQYELAYWDESFLKENTMAPPQFPNMSPEQEKAILNQLGDTALTPDLGPSLLTVLYHVKYNLSQKSTLSEIKELAHCLNHIASVLDTTDGIIQ